MGKIKKYQYGGSTDQYFGNRTKEYLDQIKGPARPKKSSRESFKVSGGDYKVVTKNKSTPSGVERDVKLKRTVKGALKGAPKGSTLSKPMKTKTSPAKFNIPGAKSGKRVSKKKK